MIGVIGGSGLYELFEADRTVEPETPYGPPSAPITLSSVGGVATAFLPRHGLSHEFPPHRVPYRANLWALRAVGVTRIIAPCASGSLRPELPPGTFVVCDQFVDRTSRREHTFFDGPDVRTSRRGSVLRRPPRHPAEAGRDLGLPMRDGGTVVVIEGPRFSTRAERLVPGHGLEVINMTAYPEGWLARELGMCYANLSLITDYDVGMRVTPPTGRDGPGGAGGLLGQYRAAPAALGECGLVHRSSAGGRCLQTGARKRRRLAAGSVDLTDSRRAAAASGAGQLPAPIIISSRKEAASRIASAV
jgi:5'-methylthioadenosine phosphorylase